MYECDGQMSLFDFMDSPNETEFCWDKDINEIHRQILELADKHNLTTRDAEWEIWNHVPQFGYRMTILLNVYKEDLTDELYDDLNKIVEFAKKRQIDLTPFQPFFLGEGQQSYFHISTTFRDKARQKIK